LAYYRIHQKDLLAIINMTTRKATHQPHDAP
jgi:hypothetical protein